MKLKKWFAGAGAALSSMILSAVVFAQQADPDLDVKINTGSNSPAWYGQWYVWALLAVFVIVIVALTNRGGRQTS